MDTILANGPMEAAFISSLQVHAKPDGYFDSPSDDAYSLTRH